MKKTEKQRVCSRGHKYPGSGPCTVCWPGSRRSHEDLSVSRKPFNEEEFYKSLPKKRMGTGVLFFNGKGEMLVLKPTYKDGWIVPGGIVEADESPRAGGLRETKEEIGLQVNDIRCLCVNYLGAEGAKTEALQFIFYGGELTEAQIAAIKLQESELSECKFVSTEEAQKILRPGLARRLPECLKAIKSGNAVYLEL